MDYLSPIPETRIHYHYRGFSVILLLGAKFSANLKLKRKEDVKKIIPYIEKGINQRTGLRQTTY